MPLAACSQPPVETMAVVVDLVEDFPAASVLFEQNRIDLGTADARNFLTEGWSWNERSKSAGTYVWSSRTSSKISFFLTRTRQITLRWRALPYRCSECETQMISLRVNGVGVDEVPLERRWAEYSVTIPSQLVEVGLNDLSFHYQWTVQPSEISDSRETRRLAVAWDWIDLGKGPNLRPVADPGAETLAVPPGARLDYYLDSPEDSEIVLDLVPTPDRAAGPLEISVLRSGDSEAVTTRLTELGTDLRIPIGKPAGLTRVRILAPRTRNGNESAGYLLRRPRVVAPTTGRSETSTPPSSGHWSGIARPNLILYVIDTLRADHLQSYGYEAARTPNFARFAAESVLFESALAQSSWTKPTTASVLTGLLPWVHQANRAKDRLSEDHLTLTELLHASGYRTAGVVNNPNASDIFGFDQGFEHFVHLTNWRAPAREHHAAALDWLDGLGEESSPFFLYVHVLEPHGPYEPPAEYLPEGELAVSDPYAGTIGRRQKLARSGRPPTGQELYDLKALYDAEIAYIDAQFAEFLRSLKDRELYRNSVIILHSDHGEEFYDHGNWDHGRSLYSELINVPLVMRLPAGQGAGTRVSLPVQQVDLMPTVLDLVALEGGRDLPGRSLLPLVIDSPESDRYRREFETRMLFSHVEYVTPTTVGVVSGDWKLVVRRPRALRSRVELFDRRLDPGDEHDVSADHPLVVGYLLTAVRREMYANAAQGEPETVELDEETRERLEALGYLN